MEEVFSLTESEKSYNICGKNLLELRRLMKLSQTDLARKVQLKGLNIDKKTISLIENQKRVFRDYEIISFAQAMKVPTSYIMEGIPKDFIKQQDRKKKR